MLQRRTLKVTFCDTREREKKVATIRESLREKMASLRR